MASLQNQSFTQIVTNFATAVQGAGTQLVNFTIGTVLRALADATAGVALWLQGLILQLLQVTRLSTSSGSDVDSWLLDFGFTRLPAVSASGLITFARFTPTNQAIVPVGSLVQTSDGTQQYVINADTTNAAYSATVIAGGGFIIPAGTYSINCTGTAITAGPSGYPDATGNVAAGTITSLVQAINGVDTVNNAAAFTNGANPETDQAVKARFPIFINSLAEGTLGAVTAAILSVQQGLNCTVIPNTQYNGTTQNGYFTVVVDDGTGYPSSQLLSNVGLAVAAVQPLGSSFSVHAPVVITASVVMSIVSAAGYVHATVAAAVNAAITAYINGLVLGQTLSYTRLAQVAYAASAGVQEVNTGYTLNGGSVDVVATNLQVILPNSISVS
jgi:uncharacterized phage protein gp47/JayE